MVAGEEALEGRVIAGQNVTEMGHGALMREGIDGEVGHK